MLLFMTILAVFGLIWAGQRRAIYFPIRTAPDLAMTGLRRVEPVRFTTIDGIALDAWFVRPSAPATGDTVIVFNGNAGHRGYRVGLAAALTSRGLACLLVDYRGYGGNAGGPSERGLADDARAARAYVASRGDVDPRRLVYFGESLGAAVAVRLATEQPPRALILRSPFTSLTDMGRLHFPWLPVSLILRDRYSSDALIGRVAAPVLVIAGTADTIVPYAHSVRLFDAAPEPKQLFTVQGADHNDEALVHGAGMADAIAQFLRRPV
jgi:fermentation-respiration switch protein FrsA (DUF1100 family)